MQTTVKRGAPADGREVARKTWGDAYDGASDPYQGISPEAASLMAQAAQAMARGKAAQRMAEEQRGIAYSLMLKARQVHRLSCRRLGTAAGLSGERVAQVTAMLATEKREGRKLSAAEKRKGYKGQVNDPIP